MAAAHHHRNGTRHGDVSYLGLALPDVARGEHFYGELLGWTFAPDQPGRERGGLVTPQVGLWDGSGSPGSPLRGAVLSYRVDDVASAVDSVRELGGTATDAVERPYGLESAARDDQGLHFYLHQFDDDPGDADTIHENGSRHGDVGYLTLEVGDLERAMAFWGTLLGWTFAPGPDDGGRQVFGVRPMSGFWQGATTGVIPAYRVDDIRDAVERVAQLGGRAGAVERQPYGLAADFCLDDQGTRFHLVQLG